MQIKTPHGQFDVRSITFGERRELHRLEINSIDSKNQDVSISKYYELLEWVMNKAFEDPEAVLKDFDDNQIDEILTAIYTEYKAPSKKKSSKQES